MRPSSAAVRGIFVVATAISAAALADPVVEGLSNAGLFGHRSFTDHSTLDVVPSLLVGLCCTALVVAIVARRMLVPQGRSFPWLQAPARALDDRTLLHLAPLIFALQLGVLFTMETLEQVVVAGHPLGGTLWLGGPLPISLALHAATGIALGFGVARLVRWSARAAVELIAFVRRLVLAQARPSLARIALDDLPLRRAFAPALDRRTGRAPPYPAS